MDREHVVDVVKKHIVNAIKDINEADIDLDKTMAEHGASSLDIVAVVSGAMRELKTKIPRTELKEIKSINGLVDRLIANNPESSPT